MDEVIETIEKGTLREAFATGTAAIISPVGQIFFRNREYIINEGKTGALADKLYNEILHIQYGITEDPFGWRVHFARWHIRKTSEVSGDFLLDTGI